MESVRMALALSPSSREGALMKDKPAVFCFFFNLPSTTDGGNSSEDTLLPGRTLTSQGDDGNAKWQDRWRVLAGQEGWRVRHTQEASGGP